MTSIDFIKCLSRLRKEHIFTKQEWHDFNAHLMHPFTLHNETINVDELDDAKLINVLDYNKLSDILPKASPIKSKSDLRRLIKSNGISSLDCETLEDGTVHVKWRLIKNENEDFADNALLVLPFLARAMFRCGKNNVFVVTLVEDELYTERMK